MYCFLLLPFYCASKKSLCDGRPKCMVIIQSVHKWLIARERNQAFINAGQSAQDAPQGRQEGPTEWPPAGLSEMPPGEEAHALEECFNGLKHLFELNALLKALHKYRFIKPHIIFSLNALC